MRGLESTGMVRLDVELTVLAHLAGMQARADFGDVGRKYEGFAALSHRDTGRPQYEGLAALNAIVETWVPLPTENRCRHA